MGWRAVCECGWRGKVRDYEAEAEHDRRVHEWVHGQVDNAPPLSAEQVHDVQVLFGVR